mmetsp:Transcript_12828/g.39464  ORF Transcript_12828/g.39464 Transcript_12828/m.39464 type:complete len:302 (-) Transcript_12828:1480-2385(-)
MRVVFRAHFRGKPEEEVFVVGSLARLGSWNPAGAVKLTKEHAGLYQGIVTGISELDEEFEYKYLLRDRRCPGLVKWDNGSNRSFVSSADELGVVLDEFPFRTGTSEWYGCSDECTSEITEEWGNYEVLKQKDSFWSLWERPSERRTSTGRGPAPEADDQRSRKRSIGSVRRSKDVELQTEESEELSYSADGMDAGPSRTKPKPFWMLDKYQFEVYEEPSQLRTLRVIANSLREDEAPKDCEDGWRDSRDNFAAPTLRDPPVSRARQNSFLEPSPLYRSKNLSSYLLWRKPHTIRPIATPWT